MTPPDRIPATASERGWLQARRLGEWLASHGERFDYVVCGAMRRHHETWQDCMREGIANECHAPQNNVDADTRAANAHESRGDHERREVIVPDSS